MSPPPGSLALVPEVLKGNLRGVARLITRSENGAPDVNAALAEISRHAGRAHTVGLTGVPGSGKSSLVRRLARAARATGRRVAIIAIDPSSQFSGGAILGDRIRMIDLADDPGIYMRSMATRGALGGLSLAALDAIDILDAAGFELIVIETVGVGQDEVDIWRAAQTTVVVSAPGLGDDIQALKAGVLEIADIHVVSKCDRADSNRTVTELKRMLTLGHAHGMSAAWDVPVLRTSAETGEGLGELLTALDRHRAYLLSSTEMEARRRRTVEQRVMKLAEEMVRARFAARRDGRLEGLLDRVARRELDPYTAAASLFTGRDGETIHD